MYFVFKVQFRCCLPTPALYYKESLLLGALCMYICGVIPSLFIHISHLQAILTSLRKESHISGVGAGH